MDIPELKNGNCMSNCPKTSSLVPQSGEASMQRIRLDHELPLCVTEWGWKYHHIGVPTAEVKENEQYITFAKVYVSGFASSPCGVEWMRWEVKSALPPLVKTVPHVAFVVADLEWELANRDFKVIVPPNPPSAGVRVAMIELDGLPIELMEFSEIIREGI